MQITSSIGFLCKNTILERFIYDILYDILNMKQYNLVIDEKLIKEVDKLIKERGMYNSRSDFIRDAIRTRLIELKKVLFEELAEDAEEHPEMRELVEELIKEREERKYTGVH